MQRHPGRSPKGGEPGPPRRSRFVLKVPDNGFAVSGMTNQGVPRPPAQAGTASKAMVSRSALALNGAVPCHM